MSVMASRENIAVFLGELAGIGIPKRDNNEDRDKVAEGVGRYLNILEKGPSDIYELQKETNLRFLEFAQLMNFMIEADLVTIIGKAGDEYLTLTSLGRRLLTN